MNTDNRQVTSATYNGKGMASPGEGSSAAGALRHHKPLGKRATINFGEPCSVDTEIAKLNYAALNKTFSHPNAGINGIAVSPAEVEEGEQQAGKLDLKEYLNNRLDEAKRRGIHGKKLGVTFRDLVVIGDSATREHIQTFWSPFYRAARSLGVMLRLLPRPPPAERVEILHGITGLCGYGEMLLVLGKPGSGCSTLLRVLANQRRIYKEIRGNVSYGGIPASEMSQYKGEIAYNQEDDIHYPKVSVSKHH
jgi:hypothetical protein